MNQKGFVITPIVWWVLGAVLVAGVAVKEGAISIEYPPKTQEEVAINVPSPTPLPTYKPTPTPTSILSNPVPIKTPPPKAIPTPAPIKQPLPVLNGGNIFGLVNAYRQQNGLPHWTVSDELCKLAEIRANFLIANNLEGFKTSRIGSHSGFRNLPEYSGNTIGENLAGWISDKYAIPDNSEKKIVEGWQSSSAHNQLLLTTEYQESKITKACIATRVKDYGSIVVLLAGDK